VYNLGGWLTRAASRVCLDLLRSRASRPEDLVGTQPPDDHPDESAPGTQAVRELQSQGVAAVNWSTARDDSKLAAELTRLLERRDSVRQHAHPDLPHQSV
jgi:DNA-directed RNA polymerase specialized sigma24 family protein